MNFEDEGILAQLRLMNPDFEIIKTNIMNIAHEFRRHDKFDDVILRFNKLLQTVYYAEQFLSNYKVLSEGTEPSENNLLYKFTPVDFGKLKPFQKLLLKMLDIFEKNNYRKKENMLYEEIKLPQKTHAWKPVC